MLTKFKKKFFLKKDTNPEEDSYRLWVIIITILGVTAALIQFKQKNEAPKNVDSAFAKPDTFIPQGFTLVPIEVANYEPLDSIIGQYGVVDLFSTPINPLEKPQRIAYSVKIIRAPRNPSHFAVLMPNDKAHRVAGHSGPLTVTVRNPKETGIKFVQEKRSKKRRRVSYDLE